MKYVLLFFILFTSPFLYCQNITTVAGGNSGHGGFYGDGGPATAAEIGYTGGVAVDKNCNIYIGDANNYRLRVVDNATGFISTISGTGVAGYNGDYIPAIGAQLNKPVYVTLDDSQNIYVAEGAGYRVRKIDRVSGIISTFAGNGTFGTSGDGGPATSAQIKTGNIAFAPSGDLILCDMYSVRKVSSTGIISRIAGTGFPGVTVEGVLAISTAINLPQGLCVDKFNNVYITDASSSVRKIDYVTGVITRVAGTGDTVGTPYGGDNIPATTCHINPFGLAVDDTGNLYIADYVNNRIEKVDVSGIIHTIAGTGVAGYLGDGGLAVNARLHFPENVVLDDENNVYVADFNNRAVRKITYRPSCAAAEVANATHVSKTKIYPNPTTDAININHVPAGAVYAVINTIGAVVLQGSLRQGSNSVAVGHLPAGVYQLHITNGAGERMVHKIVKQ